MNQLVPAIEQLNFSAFEIVALMGVGQSLYIAVYLLFRSGRISRGGVPLVYFLNMSALFIWCFLEYRLPTLVADYEMVKWALWTLQAPLCCLLIIQVAQIYKVPSLWQYWVVLLVPGAYVFCREGIDYFSVCEIYPCPEARHWMWLGGIIASVISLLSIAFNRNTVFAFRKERNHKERYWLIIALIVINIASIGTMLVNMGVDDFQQSLDITVLLYALALVYLAGTSLFRIYPQAVHVAAAASMKKPTLTVEETALAETIENLVFVQKVYHETSYARADMARECGVSEALVSKVISLHFGKSFPQLLNTQRVEDAKRLLQQTEAPAKIIAGEVGFNSLASFNRVFKDITGHPPSFYRQK